ncbi:RIP metalloprotease RseP [Desmospora activa]|uniref:Zinc metalloprotease n=1 Tax=Desmospora activa DSM 45169 TaxID=1121389 RepID=A0A2T4ZAR3_9BACL|nr:RIP metalloprotease RseP [Desmospora activa]PTM58969.1 site-2 protease [Desmospora activa DSM 45169]
MDQLQTIVSFILVISVLVFIHELGHFLFAKRAGILVREFAIGFGPKIFSVFRGETLYSIRLLPLGGYVRMAGEDPEIVDLKTGTQLILDKEEDGRVLRIRAPKPGQEGAGGQEIPMDQGDPVEDDLPPHLPSVASTTGGKLLDMDLEDRLFILLEDESGREIRHDLHPQALIQYDEQNTIQIAPLDRQFGSKSILDRFLTIAAGPVFNFILTIILIGIVTMFIGLETRVSINGVVENSPAEGAGIKSGDIVREIEGKPVTSITDIRIPLVESQGEPVDMVLERANQTYETRIRPELSEDQNSYLIGIEMRQEMRDATLSESVVQGFKGTYEMAVVLFRSLEQLITGKVGVDNLAGPVGIADITGQAAEAGWIPLLRLTAVLSLNLGILNLLPIPALDGSRLVFILVEAVRGRPVDPHKESVIHFVGFALLMMLMLFVTYNDIVRLFFNG